MSTLQATENRRLEVAGWARKAFAQHVVETLHADGLYRHYRCGKPGDGVYHFHVVTFPGRLIITGDIGFLAVERTADMLAWSRSAVHSIGYFAEKVPKEITIREYSPELAKAWFAEQLADEDLLEGTRAALRDLDETVDFSDEHQFYVELYASEELGDYLTNFDRPQFDDYTHSFLWCREALMWLLNQLDKLATVDARLPQR